MSNESELYQHQPWHIKLWRRRHYITIPFVAVKIWMIDEGGAHNFSFSASWSIAIGLAQIKMKWTYSYDEIMQRMGIKTPPE